jgi:ABC-type transport system involved in multi-copper enzyme maturation permease subunit
MRGRIHAAAVIARRQIQETLLSPGLYVTLAIGLALGAVLVRGFAAAIDSSGFNPQLNPLYDIIARFLAGTFGAAFVGKLFSEGPYLFALLVSFAPVFAYLAIASVFRFGLEKTAGAVELLTYGPADGTAYVIGSFLKDVALTLLSLLVILVFLAVSAAAGNLVLGPLFFWALPVVFLAALAVCAYGILCSIIASNASSALALFVAVLLLFLLVIGGSYSIASAPVRSVATVAAAVLQWISPFFYTAMCFRGLGGSGAGAVLGGLALLIVLAAALLAAGHAVISRRGVRA